MERLLPVALRRVGLVWGDVPIGSGRERPARVELPATLAEVTQLTGSTAPQMISAVTTLGGVLVLSPQLWSRTSQAGRLVVLTHELTHVRLGTFRPAGQPGWLVEGSAELTAYAATGLSPAQACPGLAARVRGGELVSRPPAESALRPGSARDLSRAYEQAHAWCRWWVSRHGQAAFVREVRRGVTTGRLAPSLRPTVSDSRSFARWLEREMRA